MTFLIDTNVCVAYLRRRSPSLRTRLDGLDPQEIVVSSIVLAELVYGAHRSADPPANLELIAEFVAPLSSLPFDDRSAAEYGRLRVDLERVGRPIGPHDMLIAAIALAHDLIVVTHNLGEFQRVTGLQSEDWLV